MKRATSIVVGMVLLGAGALVVTGSTQRGEAPLVTAGPGSLRQRVLGRAVVEAAQGVADVRSLSEGQVVSVSAFVGQKVQKGAILAEVESGLAAAEVARLRAEKAVLASAAASLSQGARREERESLAAELSGAEAEHAFSLQQLQRDEALAGNGALSKQQLERGRVTLEIAQARVETLRARLGLARSGARQSDRASAAARVEAAKAALQAAETRLARTRLVAPISGVVVARRVDPGDTLPSEHAGALFEIADLRHLRVRAEFEELQAAALQENSPFSLTVEGHPRSIGTGRLESIGPRLEARQVGANDARERADGLVRAAWATVDWTEELASVALGQRFDIWVELPPRAAQVLVPRSAVHVLDGRTFVQTPDRFGFRNVDVELIAQDDSWVEVAGLSAGSQVRVEQKQTAPTDGLATARSDP